MLRDRGVERVDVDRPLQQEQRTQGATDCPRFRFSSPLDVGLDRQGYFERCWPGAGQGQEIEFERVIESGDDVIVTCELRQTDGSRGRNTEILTFEDDQVREVEVYFGWNIE